LLFQLAGHAELLQINPLTEFFLYVAGCVGGINGLANILGNEVCDIYRLFMKSKLQEAVELHLRLVTPNAMVRSLFDISKRSGHYVYHLHERRDILKYKFL
jgi:dihydrodipicolinate synthase/N-acetylneuraminate lyase